MLCKFDVALTLTMILDPLEFCPQRLPSVPKKNGLIYYSNVNLTFFFAVTFTLIIVALKIIYG